MMIVRPIKTQDLDGLERCAMKAGIGLTHLPKRQEALEKKVQNSLSAFSKKPSSPKHENYLFVLSDHKTEQMGGTSSIYSRTGASAPMFVFTVKTLPALPEGLPSPSERRTLQLKAYRSGPTEICGLYLLPECRKEGLGKLLSLSRFLFIASHLQRFTETVIANMRGVIHNNISPFWDAVGHRFLNMNLQEVMSLRTVSEEFIPTVFPDTPLYAALLPTEAQHAIGQTHPNTKPAINMLLQEGFQFIHEIDPFDGGPLIGARTAEIDTVKNSRIAIVDKISDTIRSPNKYLLANTRVDFRACYGSIEPNPDDTTKLTAEMADALEVNIGDSIRYIQLKGE